MIRGARAAGEYLFVDVEGFLRHFYFDNPGQAEVLIQRINSQAMFLKLDQYPEIAKKILRILDIMRDTEEFYLEEAKGGSPGSSGEHRPHQPLKRKKRSGPKGRS